MTGVEPIPQVIPQPLADRYVAMLGDFISVAHEAIDSSSSTQANVWRQKVVPLLDSRFFAAKTAMRHLSIGDENPLLAHALQSRFLARDLDGYGLDFAGEQFATQLKEKQHLVVFAAWHVCQAAGAV